MAQVDRQQNLWGYFGRIPAELGWQERNTIENGVTQTQEFVIYDASIQDGVKNEVEATASLCGTGQGAIAEATFHQSIHIGDHKAGVEIGFTNEDEELIPRRRLFVSVRVLDPYPQPRVYPDPGSQVVLKFGDNYRLRVARVMTDMEELGDKMPDGIEDAPQVQAVLRRMKITDPSHQRLNPGKTLSALEYAISPAEVDGVQQGPPEDLLSLFTYDKVDDIEVYLDDHLPPEGAPLFLN